MAARISEIFLSKESGECIFFYKESKSNKKIWLLGGEEVWMWPGLVILFYSESKSILFSFWRGEGKGKLASISEFVLQRIQV